MLTRRSFPIVAGLLPAVLVSLAAGQTVPAPIFSTFPDQTNRVIPGSGGQTFLNALGGIDKVRVSSNGQWFVLKGTRTFLLVPEPVTGPTQDATRDEIILAGRVVNNIVTSALILGERDGFPAGTTGLLPGEANGLNASDAIGVNNNGVIAASLFSPTGAAFPNVPTTANRIVVRGQVNPSGAGVSSFGVYAREGSPAAGLPGYNYGTDMFVDGVADSGDVLFRTQGMLNGKRALMLGSSVLVETFDGTRTAPFVDAALTIPDTIYSNLSPFTPLGSTPIPSVTPSGSSWAMVGQLNNSLAVMVKDQVTQFKQLDLMPETIDNVTVGQIGFFRLASNGQYITRYSDNGLNNFVRSASGVRTRSNLPCVTCYPAAWRPRIVNGVTSSTFGNVALNAAGRWVVSGLTDSTDELNNFVLIADGRSIILREGDAMDLNGDGIANDDAVLLGLVNDSVQLNDDNTLWFLADVRRPLLSAAAGSNVDGRVLYRMVMPPPACGLADIAGANQSIGADGTLTADDIIVFLGNFFAPNLCADVAGPNQSTEPDGVLSADDIIVFLGRYFGGC